MEAGQVDAGLGHQAPQPRHKTRWLEDDMGSAVSEWRLELIAHPASEGERQALFRDGRSGNVVAQNRSPSGLTVM